MTCQHKLFFNTPASALDELDKCVVAFPSTEAFPEAHGGMSITQYSIAFMQTKWQYL